MPSSHTPFFTKSVFCECSEFVFQILLLKGNERYIPDTLMVRATRRIKRAVVPFHYHCFSAFPGEGKRLANVPLSPLISMIIASGTDTGPDMVQRESVHLTLEEGLRAFNKPLMTFD